MTNILDTVEPDVFFDDGYLSCGSAYSRETLEPAIERLLAEHRKQVLLEAAKHFESLSFVEMDETGVIVAYAEDELRRMASGEKHE
jgi:hypothetical protein